MAVKTPLVVGTDGYPQQVQSVDSLAVNSIPLLTADSSLMFVEGLECSVNGGNTQFLDLAIGRAVVDSLGIRYTVTSAAFTKRLNAAWVIGSNAGGLLTGSSFPASTTLHVYVMRRRSDGVVDHGVHTSPTQTTFTDGSSNVWDLRLHMSLRTGASVIVPINQIGNRVEYLQQFLDLSADLTGATQTVSTTVPTGVVLEGLYYLQSSTLVSGYGYLKFCSLVSVDTTPSGTDQDFIMSSAAQPSAGDKRILTNTSGQIRLRSNVSTTGNQTRIFTKGYIHPRGGNPTAAQTVVLNNGFNYVGYFGGGVPTASPLLGDTWREDDINNLPLMDWFWDGSTWKSIDPYYAITTTGATLISVTTGLPSSPFNLSNFNIFLINVLTQLFVSTTNSGTQYWTVQYQTMNSSGTAASISGAIISTQSLSANANLLFSTTVNTLFTQANCNTVAANPVRVSTAGNLQANSRYNFRYSRP